MASRHAFCTMHRIAYNRDLDPICPQCSVQRIMPPEQLEYDSSEQAPRSKSGELLDAFTLEPRREPTK